MRQHSLILLVPSLTEMLLALYRKWEKIPILEAHAIGYRTGPKIGIFSQCRRNAKDIPVRWYWLKWVNLCRTVDQRALSIYHTRLSFSRLAERSVSDGNLCGLETREGPWGTPPGGGYYIDDPDPFWTPQKMNFKPVF